MIVTDTKKINLIKKIGFSDEEVRQITDLSEKYKLNTEYQKAKEDLISEKVSFEDTVKKITEIAEKTCGKKQHLYILLMLEHIDVIYDKYKKMGVEEEIIYDSLGDIKVKADECKRVEKFFGLSRLSWLVYLYKALVFKLGRFQYAFMDFEQEYYEKNGVVLKKGMPTVSVHIPESDEKMSDDAREKSYKMAYDFFKKFYPESLQGGYLPVTCNTWLFFEKHEDFLGDNSSIVRFMKEFDIIAKYEEEEFGAGLWLFGREWGGKISEYPQKTRLQKAYVKWLSSGNKTGSAYGVKLLKY